MQLRPCLVAVLYTLLMLVGLPAVIVAATPAPALASSEAVIMGMPVTGEWAYDTPTTAVCGPNLTETSHPSCHESFVGHWGIDYYANSGTEVKLNGTSPQGTVSFKSLGLKGGQTCGQGVDVNVYVNNTQVGTLYITHLSGVVASSDIANGGKVGTVYPSCFGVNHIHFEYKNTVSGYSCYVNYSNESYTAGMTVDYGKPVGVLGSTNNGTKQVCSSLPTTSTPAADNDADGTPDSQDRCPRYVGPVNNRACPLYGHTVTGNFNGDQYTDVVSFFDEGNDSIAAWLFAGNGSGVAREQKLWTTGSGQWNWSNSTFVAGDFTGDGKDDVVALYDYDSDNLGVWLFAGTGNGISQKQFLWATGNGQWNMRSSQFYAGNWNGDQYSDILAVYDYGNDEIGTWLFAGAPNGISGRTSKWRTGQGMWNAKNSKYVVGHFNGDTNLDLLAFYNHSNDNLGVWLFAGNGDGVGRESFKWATGNGQWNWSNSTFVAGSFSGADSYTDVVAYYNYGSDNLGLWLFPGNGVSLGARQLKWTTGNGMWNMANVKLFAGQFTADTSSDVVAFYDHSNANLGCWLFSGTGSGVGRESLRWSTGPGMWNWPNA